MQWLASTSAARQASRCSNAYVSTLTNRSPSRWASSSVWRVERVSRTSSRRSISIWPAELIRQSCSSCPIAPCTATAGPRTVPRTREGYQIKTEFVIPIPPSNKTVIQGWICALLSEPVMMVCVNLSLDHFEKSRFFRLRVEHRGARESRVDHRRYHGPMGGHGAAPCDSHASMSTPLASLCSV